MGVSASGSGDREASMCCLRPVQLGMATRYLPSVEQVQPRNHDNAAPTRAIQRKSLAMHRQSSQSIKLDHPK